MQLQSLLTILLKMFSQMFSNPKIFYPQHFSLLLDSLEQIKIFGLIDLRCILTLALLVK